MAGLDRRFGPSLREDPIERPGLVIDDSNDTYVILSDGTRVLLDGNGAPGPPGPATFLPAAYPARYVNPAASDSNDGLSPDDAMATIQAAYDSLPSVGGSLVLLNGSHSVGAGFVGAARKPAVFTSFAGKPPWVSSPPDATQMPVIVGTGANLVRIVADASNIGNGWAFQGLGFDMSGGSVVTGILAEDLNHLRVNDCTVGGRGSSATTFIRSKHPNFDDVSWYRIRNNLCRLVGLCYLNDGGSGNCNNNQIQDNIVFGCSGFAIRLSTAQRCTVQGNNLEGDAGMSGVQWLGSSHYNYTLHNGGEGNITPYLQYESGAWGNRHDNFGSPAGSGVVVNDLTGGLNFAIGTVPTSVSVTWDPPAVADGAVTTTTVAVIGAVVGRPAIASFTNLLPTTGGGSGLSAQVTAPGIVTVMLWNRTGSSLDLASGTLRVDLSFL